MRRVSDYFLDCLAQRGVDSAFMVSGGQMMHLIDAVGRHPGFRYFCNHHEQAAAMAADAYARMRGVPGLCFATGGPGGTNVVTSLVGAYQDSIPIVFLTGQCKVSDTMRGTQSLGLRQKGFLEVDIVPIVASATKYAAFVARPEDARYHIEQAIFHATTGRPGPVLLDVPLDVQGAMIDPELLRGFEIPVEPLPDLSPAIDDILDSLSRAKRPLVFAGHGIRCANSTSSFYRLIDALHVPIVTTQLAKDLLPYEHPRLIGHPGIKGDRSANFAVQQADWILVLGSSLALQNVGWEVDQFAPHAKKIHVDPDPHVLKKTRGYVTDQVRCETRTFIERLHAALAGRSTPLVSNTDLANWESICRDWKHRFPSALEPHHHEPPSGRANLYEVVETLSSLLPDDAVILTDAGQPYYVVPQALQLRSRQRYLVPGSLAEMGWAVPAALGASVAEPDRCVVAIVGDGSMQTNLQELQSISHVGANIKLMVINNEGYASIRGTQRRFFDSHFVGSTVESGVSLPNWQKVADTFGFRYVSCPCRGELRERVAEALSLSGPVLCEIRAIPDQNIIPAVESIRTPDGKMNSAPLDRMSPEIPDDKIVPPGHVHSK